VDDRRHDQAGSHIIQESLVLLKHPAEEGTREGVVAYKGNNVSLITTGWRQILRQTCCVNL
jgi:hypothetical protein